MPEPRDGDAIIRIAEVFRELGREDNKRLARQVLASVEDTVIFEAEITSQPKGSSRTTRI